MPPDYGADNQRREEIENLGLGPKDYSTDLYAALNFPNKTVTNPKEATVSEIRSAYRKLALEIHPDKITDESQREPYREKWHLVQRAYEVLSSKFGRQAYEQGRANFLSKEIKEAKLAELKRELREHRRTDSYSSPREREMRNGHIVEERVPMETFLDEAMRFTDEPNPMGRKHEEFGRRAKTKPTDERKKSRTPTSSYRAAKDLRESTKASQADRAKKLDRERRRDASAKYEDQDQFNPYSPRIVPSDSDSDFADPKIFLRTRQPSSARRTGDSRRPESSSRRRPQGDPYYHDDEYSDRYDSKHDSWQSKAEEHIHRSKYEGDVRPRLSRSPPRRRATGGYDSAEREPETSASRRSARSSRSTKDQDRSSSRNNSYEHIDRDDYFKPPKLPSATTSPTVKSSIRPSLFTRATTSGSAFTRPKRESSSRDESILNKMAREQVPPSRSSKLRNNDSGYSSSSTPEMPQRGHSPKVTARYKIDPETIIIEPSKSKYRTASPDRDRERDRDRSSRTMPKRASTFAEPSRIEIRSVQPSRTFTDVEYTRPVGRSDVKYAKEIRPTDASYSPARHSQKVPSSYYDDHRHPPPSRRQSAYA